MASGGNEEKEEFSRIQQLRKAQKETTDPRRWQELEDMAGPLLKKHAEAQKAERARKAIAEGRTPGTRGRPCITDADILGASRTTQWRRSKLGVTINSVTDVPAVPAARPARKPPRPPDVSAERCQTGRTLLKTADERSEVSEQAAEGRQDSERESAAKATPGPSKAAKLWRRLTGRERASPAPLIPRTRAQHRLSASLLPGTSSAETAKSQQVPVDAKATLANAGEVADGAAAVGRRELEDRTPSQTARRVGAEERPRSVHDDGAGIVQITKAVADGTDQTPERAPELEPPHARVEAVTPPRALAAAKAGHVPPTIVQAKETAAPPPVVRVEAEALPPAFVTAEAGQVPPAPAAKVEPPPAVVRIEAEASAAVARAEPEAGAMPAERKEKQPLAAGDAVSKKGPAKLPKPGVKTETVPQEVKDRLSAMMETLQETRSSKEEFRAQFPRSDSVLGSGTQARVYAGNDERIAIVESLIAPKNQEEELHKLLNCLAINQHLAKSSGGNGFNNIYAWSEEQQADGSLLLLYATDKRKGDLCSNSLESVVRTWRADNGLADDAALSTAAEAERKKYELQITSKLFRSLVGAVQTLETESVAHKDLKPANVLVDNQSQAYIIDLMISCLYGDSSASGGTPGTQSSDQFLKKYGPQCNVPATGLMMLSFLMSNSSAYASEYATAKATKLRELRAERTEKKLAAADKQKIKNFAESAITLLSIMGAMPEEARQRLADPDNAHFSPLLQLVEFMISPNPAERLTPADVLASPHLALLDKPVRLAGSIDLSNCIESEDPIVKFSLLCEGDTVQKIDMTSDILATDDETVNSATAQLIQSLQLDYPELPGHLLPSIQEAVESTLRFSSRARQLLANRTAWLASSDFAKLTSLLINKHGQGLISDRRVAELCAQYGFSVPIAKAEKENPPAAPTAMQGVKKKVTNLLAKKKTGKADTQTVQKKNTSADDQAAACVASSSGVASKKDVDKAIGEKEPGESQRKQSRVASAIQTAKRNFSQIVENVRRRSSTESPSRRPEKESDGKFAESRVPEELALDDKSGRQVDDDVYAYAPTATPELLRKPAQSSKLRVSADIEPIRSAPATLALSSLPQRSAAGTAKLSSAPLAQRESSDESASESASEKEASPKKATRLVLDAGPERIGYRKRDDPDKDPDGECVSGTAPSVLLASRAASSSQAASATSQKQADSGGKTTTANQACAQEADGSVAEEDLRSDESLPQQHAPAATAPSGLHSAMRLQDFCDHPEIQRRFPLACQVPKYILGCWPSSRSIEESDRQYAALEAAWRLECPDAPPEPVRASTPVYEPIAAGVDLYEEEEQRQEWVAFPVDQSASMDFKRLMRKYTPAMIQPSPQKKNVSEPLRTLRLPSTKAYREPAEAVAEAATVAVKIDLAMEAAEAAAAAAEAAAAAAAAADMARLDASLNESIEAAKLGHRLPDVPKDKPTTSRCRSQQREAIASLAD